MSKDELMAWAIEQYDLHQPILTGPDNFQADDRDDWARGNDAGWRAAMLELAKKLAKEDE